MVDSVANYRLIDTQFSRRLDRFICINRFFDETDALYLVTEFLEVQDILRLTGSCRILRKLLEIPYIQIRMLKCKLNKYENPELPIRHGIEQGNIDEQNRAINIRLIKIERRSSTLAQRIAELNKAKLKLRECKQKKLLNNSVNNSRDAHLRRIVQIQNQMKKPNETQTIDVKKRYSEQLEKIRNKRLKEKEYVNDSNVIKTTIKLPGKQITVYRPKNQETKLKKSSSYEPQIFKADNGKEVPIVRLQPGEKFTVQPEVTRYKTYKTINYITNSVWGLFKKQ